ncbi:MAG TPA: O-antigen ligase family protein [Stenomitos sp.]
MNINQTLVDTLQDETNEPILFKGVWLCWEQLSQAEKFISSFIILTPAWWFFGWTYSWFFIVGSILLIHQIKKKDLILKRPSWLVISGLLFHCYRHSVLLLNSSEVGLSVWVDILVGICFYFIIWYIENNNIRIRVKVLAWAISVLALEIISFWIVAQLIFKAPHFIPPRTLVSQFLDRSERYIQGSGASNYLLPYWPEDKLPGGFARFAFFYPVPEDFGLISGAISAFSLELKNHYWRIVLFCSGIFLLFVSGTRMAWISFLLILVIRCLIVLSKNWGIIVLYALIGFFCFVMLSVPQVTDITYESFSNTTQSGSNLRKDSSEVRGLIYRRTWEEITTDPEIEKLIFGRGAFGPGVVPGFEPAKIGSHSFILGTLIYRQGLLGTSIFVMYWTLMSRKLFFSKDKYPLSSPLIFLFISFTFPTMEFTLGHNLILLFALLPTHQFLEVPVRRGRQRSYVLA